MVKIDLITGFLGAGKTTFLLKYAKSMLDRGMKIGILEYDYGAVNVDMLMLRQLQGSNCTVEMLAAACDEDCLKRRFKTKLIAMAMSGYDRVIIEPSGVFDMDMFFDTLRDEPLENWYEIGAVITIVDAMLDVIKNPVTDYLLATQVASAGVTLLSKLKFANKNDIVATKKLIEDAASDVHLRNFKANYVEKGWDTFDENDYEELRNAGYNIVSCDKTIAGVDTEFSSVSFLSMPSGLESFKEKLTKLFSDESFGTVLRVKGFISDNGQGYEINATNSKTFITENSRGQGTVIVIGSHLDNKKINDFMMS